MLDGSFLLGRPFEIEMDPVGLGRDTYELPPIGPKRVELLLI
jgi:hypothetical protein